MKIFSLIFLLAFFSVSNLHAYDQDTAKAKIEIGKKVNDAQNLARNKKYGKAIKMLELISQELESRPKLKPHFTYLPSLIVSYNKKISEL
ncbi:MAG: hypothetical protein HN884_18570, partial [Rhodospirillaceae bacterium]|nr:hypothetical protein [Rhodospirillaceae bacterium]